MTYRKHDFPACAKLPNVKFDIDKLKEEVIRLNAEWVNVYQANRGLCATHEDLARDNHAHFDQINLTYYESSDNDILDLTQLKNECRLIANSDSLGTTKVARYRTKIRRLENLPPAMNEHNWYHPLPLYKDSYIKTAIESQFKSTPIRVRMTRLQPGKFLTPHIDYDPSYAVRIIVPIQGDADVYNISWPRNVREEYQLVADGSAYFLNTGYKHSVEHRGKEPRIALMFSLPSQEDVEDIVLK